MSDTGRLLWARPEHYRASVREAIRAACASVGFNADWKVLLVGFPSGDGEARVVPAHGPYQPAMFAAVPDRVTELLEQAADPHPVHMAAASAEGRLRSLRDSLQGRAITEVFERVPDSAGWAFFAGCPVLADSLDTQVVLATEAASLKKVPHLPSGDHDRSLIHALAEEILERLRNALRAPIDGDLLLPLRALESDIVRAAAARFIRTTLHSVVGRHGGQPDALFNALSVLPYEGRPAKATLLLAPEPDMVDVELQLHTPVGLRDKRTIRKLMEASSPETALLLDDEARVYGIGRLTGESQQPGLLISFRGRASWELRYGDRALLSIRDGEARLPAPALDLGRLRELAERLFPDADTGALTELALAAGQHSHGAMLVISQDAAGEAARLSPQAIAVRPDPVPTALLARLTAMDGAILLDPHGRCHAIGVILDGVAAGHGDPARGSRYNNPVRYLDSDPPATIVIVYSADGGVDILPDLRPRQNRRHVAGAVQRYIRFADRRPPVFADIFEAWDAVHELAFYLSPTQCESLNAATGRLKSWCAETRRPLVGLDNLEPDPLMNATYWR
ncbi:hypothetical protein AB0877_07130 [Micromonospora sp. NPDC047644]|uniref:hypothetical protein n=1 Tax=Micromonospora sp. NPDC047644 TaxID=3157203 RepID=UPI0034523A19